MEKAIAAALEDPEQYKAELTFEQLVQNSEKCPYRMPTTENSIQVLGHDEKTRDEIVDMAARFLTRDDIQFPQPITQMEKMSNFQMPNPTAFHRVRPILHEDSRTMFQRYLAFVKAHGNRTEKRVMKESWSFMSRFNPLSCSECSFVTLLNFCACFQVYETLHFNSFVGLCACRA